MNYGQQQNERVKNQIVDGLFSELKERPFSEIRIASLIKTAGVGRTSYYRNFDSKEEILSYYLNSLVEKRMAEGRPTEWTKQSVPADLEKIFSFFQMEKERFLLLFNSGLSAYIFDFFRSIPNSERAQNDKFQNTPYLIPFFTGAMPSVLFEWLKKDTPESPQEMAQIVTELLPPVFFSDD
ncbi:TetR/AcrR family transcriptional regulator [Fructobacillus sp. W13]|uniref:TetR/AcrR family transcriptional regulator n=1 Tax=Fructobacillus apis TaxID=2935017 RepID=A0ABT0ZPU1_9LACO|nr:TetR/AcrR family transcriptional regulator [Fructobacillus apis]MCO0832009.1 TetR/AcrR family transcriptional regulator [Fructobacillus apis]